MRTTFRKVCAVMGGVALLTGGGIATDSIPAILVWLVISVALLYAGRAFSFQQNR